MPESVVISLSIVFILAAFFAVWEVYENYGHSHEGKERSFLFYLLGVLSSGLTGAALAGSYVFESACSGNSGAGCAFGVLTLLFPFSFSGGIAAFLFIWASQGKHISNG